MYRIINAEEKDLSEILELQYLSFKSEAEMIGSCEIPALKQTYEGIAEDFHNGVILKMLNEKDAVIGSVRAFDMGDYVEIARLMVHPAYRRKGLATLMLKEIEKHYPGRRLELYTCTRSLCNIALYESVGYKKYKTVCGDSGLEFVYLEK
ncbi:MAG: GNAT family N-acetyltransferase [Clostridia bacterium]|nr:GNAT family N-acetyltransferase [Clostridia bacterium]